MGLKRNDYSMRGLTPKEAKQLEETYRSLAEKASPLN